jgi:hypothetical protein
MERKQIVQNTVAKLLEAFQNEDFPKKVAYTIISRSKEEACALSCANWSLANTAIMLANDTDAAAGYRQWQQLNRFVKKGSRAFYIFVPLVRRTKKNEAEPETEKNSNNKPPQQIYGFRTVPVFRLEDTEGEPLPFRKSYEPMDPPAFLEVAKKLGLDVEYGPMLADYFGYFDPTNKKIKLCSQTPVVFFHELAHAMDQHLGLAVMKDHENREIVAEFSAVVLASIVGVTGYESRAYDYISCYADTYEPEEVLHKIMSVLKDVEAIVTGIIAMAETKGGDKR